MVGRAAAVAGPGDVELLGSRVVQSEAVNANRICS